MAGEKKIEIKGNYLYITDLDSSIVEQRLPMESTYYSLETREGITNTFVVFHILGGFSDLVRTSAYGVFKNNDPNRPLFTNGTTEYTLATLITFLDSNTAGPNMAIPLPISPRPNTTGSNGTTPYKLTSLASTNANVVKASGGNLYSIVAIGLTSTVRYLKLYNKASAPTVGTDTPIMTIPIPANTQGAGIAIPFSMGVNFPLGIAIAITSGVADNDTGVIGAGDVVINLTYA
jgi:hypothetical protein